MSHAQALAAIRPGPRLAERTTLGIGGTCLAEVTLGHERHLDELAALLVREHGRPFVIGAGSNLLADDRELDLVLVRVAHDALELINRGDTTLVRAGAGLKLPVLLAALKRAGLSGLEGLAGIPGTVGGALAMNAGSWGHELGQCVHAASLWTAQHGLVRMERDALGFGYRSFDPGLPAKWLAWEVELKLLSADPAQVAEAMGRNMGKKRASQPVGERTAGCVFKNPEGDSAGRLLDEAGMKGAAVGSMRFSELHANFLVNERHGRDGGTFAQATELLEQGREAVRERTGVTLETEVIVLT